MAKRGIHNNFHASLLRKHHPNDDALFPMRSVAEPYDFGEPSTVEWLVDEIIDHHWDGRKLPFLVSQAFLERFPIRCTAQASAAL